MGHTRRKFFAALETAPQDATTALDFVLQLYEVEYLAAERDIAGTDEHLALRQALMGPIFEKFELWLRDQSGVPVPFVQIVQSRHVQAGTEPSAADGCSTQASLSRFGKIVRSLSHR